MTTTQDHTRYVLSGPYRHLDQARSDLADMLKHGIVTEAEAPAIERRAKEAAPWIITAAPALPQHHEVKTDLLAAAALALLGTAAVLAAGLFLKWQALSAIYRVLAPITIDIG